MGLFSKLFGSRTKDSDTIRTTSAQNPYSIDDPTLGFLNLRGSASDDTINADRDKLQSLFTDVRQTSSDVPPCQVLFLYCDIDVAGRIAGRSENLREIIKSAGAYIAVVASENSPEHYMKCLGPANDWSANIALTIDRKGDKLSKFFAELFQRMYAGKSMPTAWVELAPQIPGLDHPDAPETIMVAEAGHLIFGRGG